LFSCVFVGQVKNLNQKKLHLIADKDLKGNFDRFQLEEMAQFSLLCTQFQPGHCPNMCDVSGAIASLTILIFVYFSQ